MNPELERIAQILFKAITPEDVFGKLSGDIYQSAKSIYYQLAKVCHEDRYLTKLEKETAHKAFVILQSSWAQCQEKINKGTYGSPTPTKLIISSKTDTYTVVSGYAEGELSILYKATNKDGKFFLLKVSRDHTFNVLLTKEAGMLKRLNAAAVGTKSMYLYVPTLTDSITVRDDKGKIRAVNIFEYKPGYFPLTQVMVEYPMGVDERHFVWMLNRLLVVLNFTHENGAIHSTILPTHCMINPETHGMMLVDWCWSAIRSDAVQVVPSSYLNWYPPEIITKQPLTPATDIYMAAHCMRYVLGADPITPLNNNIHPKFQRLLDACIIKNPNRRPQNAWSLYKQFQEISAEVFGPKKHVKFTLAAQEA